MHAYEYTRMYVRTNTHTYLRTRAHLHTYIHTQDLYACVRKYTNTIKAYIHTQHTHTGVHAHMYIYIFMLRA
jgi:hypothetical protein